MSAATVVDGMEAALEMATSPIGDTPALPANEGQARELTGLDPAEAVDVMAKVNEATGGRPTAAAIRSEIGSRRIDPEPDIDAEVEAEPVEIAPGFTDAALAELNAPTPTPAPAQPATPKRRPITDAFDSATFNLKRAVESVNRLAADDRLKRNKDQIKASNLSDLIRVRDALNSVITQLEG
ncbi:hypothetical protein [Gordonia westfalica]|nr:hypothetical protein [Gordonia westfalica]SDT83989.1 hypothetical protein SAMN04488548_10550 [Gordonia westfalica]